MREEIIKWNAKRDKLLAEVELIDDVIAAFQKVCVHKWLDDGHDSHYRYSKCSICGEKDKT